MGRIKIDPPLVLTPGPDSPVRLVISRNAMIAVMRVALAKAMNDHIGLPTIAERTKAGFDAIADAIIREGAKPEEVTPEMIEAGIDEMWGHHLDDFDRDEWRVAIRDAYRALQAAAR